MGQLGEPRGPGPAAAGADPGSQASTQQPASLPLSLRRLWGVEPGNRPGQKPSLDVRSIARAAIDLADDGGLAAVSMARVAASLDVTTMALYRYVASKEELLEVMLEVAADDPPPLGPELEWREALVSWAEKLADIYRAHPWAVDVPVPGPPRGPHQLAWAEQGMACLRVTGLPAPERLAIVMLLLVYVRGHASLARQMAAGLAQSGATEDQADQAFVALAASLDAGRYPELRSLWSTTDLPPVSHQDVGSGLDEAAFGLERILDGIELHVRRQRRRAGGGTAPPPGG